LYASEDAKFLLKKGKNLDDYRPDILYQVCFLLQFCDILYVFLFICYSWHLSKAKIMIDVQALHEILDSRINKVGGIEAVYVKTDTGLLFEVKTHARIPRTWKRFCGIMCKYAGRQRDTSVIFVLL